MPPFDLSGDKFTFNLSNTINTAYYSVSVSEVAYTENLAALPYHLLHGYSHLVT